MNVYFNSQWKFKSCWLGLGEFFVYARAGVQPMVSMFGESREQTTFVDGCPKNQPIEMALFGGLTRK